MKYYKVIGSDHINIMDTNSNNSKKTIAKFKRDDINLKEIDKDEFLKLEEMLHSSDIVYDVTVYE